MEATKVGIREFRAGMAEIIASSTPVAVTRHGQTIGYFIPTHGQADADVASLKKASKTLDRLLALKGVDVDAVVADFNVARQRAQTLKKLKSKATLVLSDRSGSTTSGSVRCFSNPPWRKSSARSMEGVRPL